MASNNGRLSSTADLPTFKLPSGPQLDDLQHISTLLHLLHHRNHNQHRRSVWYRHFNLFRRHLRSLLSDIATLQEVPTTHLARHQKKDTDAKLELNIRQRLAFWRDIIVPKAQHAFSQVTADGRFAVLGVMLIAALGSVCRIFGLVTMYEQLGQVEVQRVLEAFAEEGWGEDEGLGVLVPRAEEAKGGAEDMGEVLQRDEDSEAKETEQKNAANESGCLGPEREVLRQSRDALKIMSERAYAPPLESGTSTPTRKAEKRTFKLSKRTESALAEPAETSDILEKPAKVKFKTKRPKEDEGPSSKPTKNKRKKNAIDELFSGL